MKSHPDSTADSLANVAFSLALRPLLPAFALLAALWPALEGPESRPAGACSAAYTGCGRNRSSAGGTETRIGQAPFQGRRGVRDAAKQPHAGRGKNQR